MPDMLETDQLIALAFVPFGVMLGAAHCAVRRFRHHLRRRHPRTWRAFYGAVGRAPRGSRLLARSLRLRFELSDACAALGDRELDVLGRRLRWSILAAIALYATTLGVVAGRLTQDLPAAAAPVAQVMPARTAAR
jgi:hypothetical protein